MTDRMILRYAYYKPFTVKFPDKCEWHNVFTSNIKWGLVWYMYRSKTSKGSGSGVYRWGFRGEYSFSLGHQTTILQAKVYASKACIMENLEKGYAGRNICILSDSQVAIEAFDSL